MPLLKYSEILTFSSEDPNHPVENLLKPDSYLKWKSKAGNNQKQEYAIIKLEKLSPVRSIDIGNEHSAFVEVLVAREGLDYQVLLVTSSFMSPLESRNSTSTNRVRMFGPDKLNKDISNQKWDRLKVICTQPFNKNVQYGLTFIKVYGPDNENASTDEEKLGNFTITEKEEDDSTISVGSFFAKRHEREKESPLVGAAAIRAASKVSEKIASRKRPLEESSSNASPWDQPANKKVKETSTSQSKAKKNSENKKLDSNLSRESITEKPSKKATTSKKVSSKPFNKLMENVVFVLSGYQNPKRAQLRDKLIRMGAKYKPDWGKGCTHLICAFKNTPKFSAVKGKGKIVKGEWIEDSYHKKTRFPWRRYSLESNGNDEESEEEVLATEICPEEEKVNVGLDYKTRDMEQKDEKADSEDTDDELERVLGGKIAEDTDEEKKNLISTQKLPKGNSLKADSDEEYDADTDVDEEGPALKRKDTSGMSLPPLKDFLKGRTFFIYGSLAEEKKKALKRYILGFKGVIADYMNSKVNIVLTDDLWDDNFDEALDTNPSLQFVKSQWLWKCCDKEKFVPTQPFVVVPQEVE